MENTGKAESKIGAVVHESFETYNKAPGVRNSQLSYLLRSPAHYKHYTEFPEPPTQAMEFGTLFHSLMEDPEAFDRKYIVAPPMDRRTKVGKETYDELLKTGKNIITIEQHNTAINMYDSIMAHPKAAELLKSGLAESSYYWTNSLFNVPCKCRTDISRDGGIIVDFKTCEDASFSSFQKSMANFGYARQAAFYLDGVTAASGVTHDKFVFIAVEKKPPFAVAIYAPDDATLDAGRTFYNKALRIYSECVQSGKWPGYSDNVEPINLPSWAWPLNE